MINILEKFFTKIIPGVESFTQEGNPSKLQSTLPLILAVVVTEILLLFLGKFIWNTHLVNAVTIVRPLDSVIQLFSISILLRLLLG
jgi:hypothetical protein|tara:strand:+ start:1128 stop:1385 length:258 start_codon:yes stop_codon:yes gene_type:complete